MNEGVVLSERAMRSIVRAFAAKHPQLNDPNHVRDRCMDYCDAFVEYLRWWTHLDNLEIEIISGVQVEDVGGVKMLLQGHFAVLHDGMVYDWTARQFDPNAPVPKITPHHEWRQEWRTWKEAMA